jgi:hypothetical protein
LIEAENKFIKACQQISVIDRKLQALHHRHRLANATGNRAMRYTIRLTLVTIEGVRTAYYEYAHMKADEIADIRKELAKREATDSSSDSDED